MGTHVGAVEFVKARINFSFLIFLALLLCIPSFKNCQSLLLFFNVNLMFLILCISFALNLSFWLFSNFAFIQLEYANTLKLRQSTSDITCGHRRHPHHHCPDDALLF